MRIRTNEISRSDAKRTTSNGSDTVFVDANIKTETMSDVPTPGYKTIIANGGIVNNNCYYRFDRRSNASGSGTFTHNSDPSQSYSTGGAITRHRWGSQSPPSTSSIDHDALVASAKAKAIAAMDRSPYEFGEDLGELRSTLTSLDLDVLKLRKTAFSFRSFYRKLKSIKGRKKADALANAWLRYKFQFRPIVQSIDNAIDSFNSGEYEPQPRQNARGFEEDTSVTSSAPTTHAGRLKYIANHYYNVRVHAHIHYKMNNPIGGFRAKNGLRNKDIPHTAWQLFPYSFMIDRVSNISNFIRGVQNLSDPTLEILCGSVTSRFDNQKDISLISHAPYNSTYSTSESGGPMDEDYFIYSRDIWSPSLADTLPDFDLGALTADANSIADGLALVWAALRR